METVRTNPELSKQKEITTWQWMARILPIVYLMGSLLVITVGLDTWTNVLICTTLTLLSAFAIGWWWWAMDTIRELMKMFDKNLRRYEEIADELSDVRHELKKHLLPGKKSDRSARNTK